MVNLPKNYFTRLAILIFVILAITFPRSISAQSFLPGDLDKDGDVDIFDYNLLITNFGATGDNPADIDGDGDVDIFDYNILISNFGKTSGTPTPNPERQACEADSNGTWKTFPDSCADYCFDYYLGPRPCLLVLTESCECGADMCWTGTECISNPKPTIPQITPTPTTKPSISPPPTPIPGQSKDIWITKDEISKLPTSGQYWDQLVSAANNLPSMSASGGHESTHDVYTMAAALVAARLNDSSRKQVVASEIIEAVNNQVENDGNSLSLTRTLPGYIIAADLIDLKNFDASADGKFRSWLEYVVYQLKLDGATQLQKHLKANNHGTQAAVVRLAADLYLGKMDDFAMAAEGLKKWLGMPNSFNANFNWGDLCWQADPSRPVGINRKGSKMTVAGALRDVDGVQPDEQRRAGCPDGSWPPPTDVHVWGGTQGIVGQAIILSRNGYPDVWTWADGAILRSMNWQYDPARGDARASGDDLWILPVVDAIYGTNFWNGGTVGYGKQVGWTDWTHAR